MDRCTAPTETDPLELCDARATTRRVIDGVSCALCEAHAAELDAEWWGTDEDDRPWMVRLDP